MDIKYRIIAVDSKEHSIVVRYFTDKITEEMLATQFNDDNSPTLNEEGYPVRCRTDYHINIFQVPSPSQEEIIKTINVNAPFEWFKMQEGLLDPNVDTSLSSVVDLVSTIGTVEKLPSVVTLLGDANTAPTNI